MGRMIEGDFARRSQAILRFDIQTIFTGPVAEIRNELAIRRPGRIAVSRAARVSEVAHVAFLGGNGENFAARFDDYSFSSRRDSHISHAAGYIFPTRHHPGKVSGGGDVDHVLFAAFGIKLVNVTCLFKDHSASASVHRLHIKVSELS